MFENKTFIKKCLDLRVTVRFVDNMRLCFLDMVQTDEDGDKSILSFRISKHEDAVDLMEAIQVSSTSAIELISKCGGWEVAAGSKAFRVTWKESTSDQSKTVFQIEFGEITLFQEVRLHDEAIRLAKTMLRAANSAMHYINSFKK